MVWNRRVWLCIVIALAFLGVYLIGIQRIANEKSRRSLQLTDEVAVADHVLVSITVTSIDPEKGVLSARLRLRPFGNLADEGGTPRLKLKLFLNNSPGQQVFEFPEGEGIIRIEASFPLEGDQNRYPFDRYETNMWFLVDSPKESKVAQLSQIQPDELAQDATQEELAIGKDLLKNNKSVPLSIAVSASTRGIKYTGGVIRTNASKGTRVHLSLVRPYNVINTSVTVMCLMMGLALSVLAVAISGILFREKFDLLPLTLSISLIFGLPALRYIQPGVPSVGVLGDYLSFIWAELIVAGSAIITIWTWLVRSHQESKEKSGT